MNAKVYKFPSKKNKHISIGLIIFIVGIVTLSFYILNIQVFIIKNIEVDGNYYLSKNDVVSLSGIHTGVNIFAVNLDKIKENLQRDPHIKNIDIRRALPNSIIIEVNERNEVAVIPYNGVYLHIDEDGYVIEVSKEYQDAKLPILSGFNIKKFMAGQYLDTDRTTMYNRSLSILKSLKDNDMEDMISEVRVDGGKIVLISSGGLVIEFNAEENIGYRLSFLKSVLIDLTSKNTKGGFVIVNESGNIVYRLKK